jgi:hypothetical protein
VARSIQFTIGRCLIAIAIIGYLCAFPELAVLLGIGVAALLFVAPVVMLSSLACLALPRDHQPSIPRR